ncbi:uncharacterized protein LOC132835320 [Hemiscyllium ocellatum]|uniref:uncharacterized protein LOC132835320 n=1 Tax=Hemiscyllium ocellatum TaxID=170820 RepID=UPI0029665E43|nr:uncharacterized protein LOC132835320 [Hemiscyllium ocellatum]
MLDPRWAISGGFGIATLFQPELATRTGGRRGLATALGRRSNDGRNVFFFPLWGWGERISVLKIPQPRIQKARDVAKQVPRGRVSFLPHPSPPPSPQPTGWQLGHGSCVVVSPRSSPSMADIARVDPWAPTGTLCHLALSCPTVTVSPVFAWILSIAKCGLICLVYPFVLVIDLVLMSRLFNVCATVFRQLITTLAKTGSDCRRRVSF